jgi:hypothetical protein
MNVFESEEILVLAALGVGAFLGIAGAGEKLRNDHVRNAFNAGAESITLRDGQPAQIIPRKDESGQIISLDVYTAIGKSGDGNITIFDLKPSFKVAPK